jgi:hypothetical protein
MPRPTLLASDALVMPMTTSPTRPASAADADVGDHRDAPDPDARQARGPGVAAGGEQRAAVGGVAHHEPQHRGDHHHEHHRHRHARHPAQPQELERRVAEPGQLAAAEQLRDAAPAMNRMSVATIGWTP